MTTLLFVLLSVSALAYSGTGYVKCNGCLNVRTSSTTNSKIIKTLKNGTKISILSSENGWHKISVGKKTGWVSGKYVTTGEKKSAAKDVAAATADINKTQEIVSYAKKYIGVRYVSGGSTPKGFDCSGFIRYVYSNFGVNLTHSASAQYRTGTAVSKSNLQVGDLLFFDTNGGRNSISHSALYIGNGKFINAESGSTRRVTISSLSESYWAKRYMGARRII